MILSTGNRLRSSRRGLTFIEVMVTAVILSVGLVAIYRSFFIGVDYLHLLACRLQALYMIESRVTAIEFRLRSGQDPDVGPLQETVQVQGGPVGFAYDIHLTPVARLVSVFQLDINLTWQERGHPVTVGRSAYFSTLTSAPTGG